MKNLETKLNLQENLLDAEDILSAAKSRIGDVIASLADAYAADSLVVRVDSDNIEVGFIIHTGQGCTTYTLVLTETALALKKIEKYLPDYEAFVLNHGNTFRSTDIMVNVVSGEVSGETETDESYGSLNAQRIIRIINHFYDSLESVIHSSCALEPSL